MLAELYVENFALIESLRIEFEKGLNIISGETGAGKSLLTDAVGLLVGGRGEKNMIRAGANRALVEATFTGPFSAAFDERLAEQGIVDDTLIISRELHREGKNICRLNGRRIGIGLLEEIGPYLLNQHSQMEQVTLFQEARQLELLDRYGGPALLSLRDQVGEDYGAWQQAKAARTAWEQKQRDREQRLDYLRFQEQELAALTLREGEMEDLRRESRLLRNSTTIFEEAKRAYDALYRGEEANAADRLYEAMDALATLGRYDESLQSLHRDVEEMYYRVEDIADTLRQYAEAVDADPQRLDWLEGRLAKLERAAKKYHCDESGLLALSAKVAAEIAQLADFDDRLNQLTEAEDAAYVRCRAAADRLSAARQTAATTLAMDIVAELRELALPDAVFEVRLKEGAMTAQGCDAAAFMISLNAGEAVGPLRQVASGGELSRILLAVKVILARLDHVDTMIFDEIDSGMGGKTAAKVGEQLKKLSQAVQVLAVTHSPLVASFADHHFFIQKTDLLGRAVVTIQKLTSAEVKREIARMLSGDQGSAVSLTQAEELLARSRRMVE